MNSNSAEGLKRSRNVLLLFEISNLPTTSVWIRDLGKVAPGKARVGEPPAGLGQGMLNFAN